MHEQVLKVSWARMMKQLQFRLGFTPSEVSVVANLQVPFSHQADADALIATVPAQKSQHDNNSDCRPASSSIEVGVTSSVLTFFVLIGMLYNIIQY